MATRFRIVVAALILAIAVPAAAAPVTIRFVATGDLSFMEGTGERGGFARLATVLAQARGEGPTFFVHAGNALSPSLLSGFDHGAHIIDLLNRLQPAVMAPGNHEFDFGPANFRAEAAAAQFPIATSNVFEADGTPLGNTVDVVWAELDGVRIAFYGLTTDETPVLASPGDLVFGDPLAAGIAKAAELRAAGADFVVAVAHTPRAVDTALAEAHAADLILSANDEVLMAYYDGTIAVIEPGVQAETVVVVTVTIDKEVAADGSASVSWRPVFDLVDTAGVAPDPAMAAAVDAYLDALDSQLNGVVGTTAAALDSRRAVVRGAESTMGDLIADALRSELGADIAITNGGGIRGDRDYAAGSELTRRDIYTELPFGNTAVAVALTGEAVLAALENGFSEIETGAGRFPQVSGLSVVVDREAAAGSRVVSVMVDGAPLDPERVYTVATNDFMLAGGDGYTMFAGAPVLGEPGAARPLLAMVVIAYIEARGAVGAAADGRISFR